MTRAARREKLSFGADGDLGRSTEKILAILAGVVGDASQGSLPIEQWVIERIGLNGSWLQK